MVALSARSEPCWGSASVPGSPGGAGFAAAIMALLRRRRSVIDRGGLLEVSRIGSHISGLFRMARISCSVVFQGMTQKVKLAPYLYDLNPEQYSAALHTEGPVLILAGAGSGKTKTLVHRIVHLLRGREVDPRKIVVVTFTNRAAAEMRERVQSFAGKEARGVTISTFHALGVRILRAHGKRLGLPDRFAVYSVPDQLAALRTATSEISIDDDRASTPRLK